MVLFYTGWSDLCWSANASAAASDDLEEEGYLQQCEEMTQLAHLVLVWCLVAQNCNQSNFMVG